MYIKSGYRISHKKLINNNTKVRTAAYNFGISKTTLIHHLLKFQEKETPTNF
jgi:hypothetical protein